jgi:hypothetical protein
MMRLPARLANIWLLISAVSVVSAAGQRSARPGDYYPSEVLDKPLGVERLPNGHTLITDAGGAYYTTTDSAVIEVDAQGNVVWTYSGDLRFAHTARPTKAGAILVTDTSNDVVIEVDRAGEIVWSSDEWGDGAGTLSDGSRLRYPNNAEELDNGHLLITDRNNDRVLEVTREGRVMWKYDGLVRPHNGHRLPNGNTLISDSEQNTIIEVNPAGEIVWSFGGGPALNWPRNGERLPNGNTLITDSRGGRVIEVDPAGRTVWQHTDLALPFEAHRLPNGNTLIADNNRRRVIEVSPGGQIVWQFRNLDERIEDALINGDFERDDDGDGLPDGWYPADLNAEGIGTFIWDGVERASGLRSASLEYHEQGRLAWLQTVRVEPGQAYRVDGQLKGQIRSGAFALQLWFVDALGGPLGDQPIIAASHGRSVDWTRASADVIAPGDAVALQVWIVTQADGRVWADDIMLSRLATTQASAIAWLAPAAAWIAIAAIAVWWLRRRQSSRRRA